MKRTAIYLRVSTDKQAQEGDSIPAQRDALRKYVKEHNYILVGEYLDDGISGTKEDRAEFQRMMEDVKRGLIELILVTKLDRIHRSLRNFLNMQDTLDKYNCDWLAIWEPMYDSSTPQGRMIINTMMNLAQFEAEQTGQRIRQVFAYKKEKGEVTSGITPVGFSIVNKRLVPDPETAEKVKSIFEHFTTTGSLGSTTRYVEELGYVRTRATIKYMLKNEKYIQIVGEDLFNDVQRLLKVNIKSSAKKVYIFSGLIACGECGHKFSGYQNHNKNHYHCFMHLSKSQCSNQKCLNEKKLETYLLDYIKTALEGYITTEKDKEKPKDNTKRIKALEKKIEKLKDLYVNDLITLEEYKADRQKYESEIATLGAPVKHDFTPLETALQLVVEERYTTFTQEKKRAFWRSIIDHITFDKDRKIEVFFL